MYALVTALNTDQDQKTRAIWKMMADRCSLLGMQMFPLPHFSWQAAESFDLAGIHKHLTKFCEGLEPFRVKTAGLGLFTGPVPVLYIAIVKTRPLLELHDQLWNENQSFAKGMNPFYAPSEWMPHITIAYKDMTPGKLGCAVEDILFCPVDFELEVSSISMVHSFEDNVGMDWTINFGKRSK